MQSNYALRGSQPQGRNIITKVKCTWKANVVCAIVYCLCKKITAHAWYLINVWNFLNYWKSNKLKSFVMYILWLRAEKKITKFITCNVIRFTKIKHDQHPMVSLESKEYTNDVGFVHLMVSAQQQPWHIFLCVKLQQ